ncbi:MAG: serine/threonine-protein kinase PknK, partial [Parachlamydiaceae bacterium]|nr:serine/threonine-protein kinase PknK [Parachlamydiaceae bacterium]
MITIEKFNSKEILFESANSVVIRALRQKDNVPVVLKIMKNPYYSTKDLAHYTYEYNITQITDLRHSIKCYELIRADNYLALVLEDIGGQPLSQWLKLKKVSIEDFFEIAIKLTQSLQELHDSQIIHKDINPANIIWNSKTRELKICDFGIATVLSKEKLDTFSADHLEGTLAYMSPEQTGRINRTVDYRTDLYSLGVTFYQLLTGLLPFETQDPVELVHAHIAKMAVPPFEIDPTIPEAVSRIVMKLISKNTESRYQSCFGVENDIQRCAEEFAQTKSIKLFPLAQLDFSGSLQIPEKLYGREGEIEVLLKAFKNASEGREELVLVAGYSGIGKSSLIQEIYRVISEKSGYLIKGKFDQFQRNIPYFAFIQAFQQLIEQLLSESEQKLAYWRDKISSALGTLAQVLMEILPNLELLIGKQPAVEKLSPKESQERFNLVVQNFLISIAQLNHPLLIFIDDLQWADLASLQLLSTLVSNNEIRHVLLIGAYRDNEVDAMHPLAISLQEFRRVGVDFQQLTLQPLKLIDVEQLIAETLKREASEIHEIALLCYEKTKGNPFYLNQFLKHLNDEKLIYFSRETKYWEWSLEGIKKQSLTENVIDLMVRKLQSLPKKTQELLKLAACIGGSFRLNTLAIISEMSPRQTASELFFALQEGYVLPTDPTYKLIEAAEDFSVPYRFLHDRVQQAAYSLIEENRKQEVHLKIGRLLKAKLSPLELEEQLFEIVNHFNFGLELIKEPAEKSQLLKYNFKAGQHARRGNAFETARHYFTVAISCMSEDPWTEEYDFTFSLYHELSKSQYLTGDNVEAESTFKLLLKKAQNVDDKIKVYLSIIDFNILYSRYSEAIQAGLTAVSLLGIILKKEPGLYDVYKERLLVEYHLHNKTMNQLL